MYSPWMMSIPKWSLAGKMFPAPDLREVKLFNRGIPFPHGTSWCELAITHSWFKKNVSDYNSSVNTRKVIQVLNSSQKLSDMIWYLYVKCKEQNKWTNTIEQTHRHRADWTDGCQRREILGDWEKGGEITKYKLVSCRQGCKGQHRKCSQ